MHNFELVPNKVWVKIYNREFTDSTHNYNLKQYSAEEVERNHKLIIDDLSAEKLAILNQIHTVNVVNADNMWSLADAPEADAMFCTKKSLILGVQTADCVPVLIAAEDGAIIGAAHCGWRSAFSGILEILASKMKEKTSQNLLAIIGPSIQQISYEVDLEFYSNFIKKSQSYGRFFIGNDQGKYLFDLPGFVISLLDRLDIKLVKHFADDTYKHPELYPSYRYATHNNLGRYKGSILSAIVKL